MESRRFTPALGRRARRLLVVPARLGVLGTLAVPGYAGYTSSTSIGCASYVHCTG